MDSTLLSIWQDEYQQAPDDTYTNDMHRALVNLLVAQDARIRDLEARVAALDKATYRALNPNP